MANVRLQNIARSVETEWLNATGIGVPLLRKIFICTAEGVSDLSLSTLSASPAGFQNPAMAVTLPAPSHSGDKFYSAGADYTSMISHLVSA